MGIQINGQTDTVTATDGSINIGGNVTVPGVLTYEDVTSVDAVGLSTFQNGIHVTGGSVGIGTDNPGIKLDVNGDIRAVDGTAPEIIVSDNFVNKRFIFGYTQSPVGHNLGSKILADGLNIGHYTRLGQNGSHIFYTNNSGSDAERLRITSSGNIGIGTDNPSTLLDVVRSSTSGLDVSMPQLKVRNTSGTQGNGSSTFNQSFLQVSSGNGAVSSVFRSSYDSAGSYGTGVDLWVSTNNYLRLATNNTERLRITSDGDIRGSLLDSGSGVNVYPEFYRRITGFESGNSVVNYLLLCTASQPQVRLTGRFLTARSPGTSACAAQLFDISFQTNHDGTHTSGAIMGLHSGSNGYGHAEAELVQLTYDSTDYYAIRFGTGWTTDFDSCYFDGIATDNVLFTHISNISETITGVTVFSADTNKGDVTIQQADLRISDGDVIMASGHGISFSAASGSAAGSTSAVLDDYEEGTFTPRISVEGQASDAAIDNVSGTYVKVGQLVHCTFNADLNGIPAGRGIGFAWQFGGLPFTSLAEASNGSEDYIGSVRIGGADHTSTYGVAGEFILRLFDNNAGGRIEVMRVSNGDIVNASLYMKDNTSCNGSITYRTS